MLMHAIYFFPLYFVMCITFYWCVYESCSPICPYFCGHSDHPFHWWVLSCCSTTFILNLLNIMQCKCTCKSISLYFMALYVLITLVHDWQLLLCLPLFRIAIKGTQSNCQCIHTWPEQTKNRVLCVHHKRMTCKWNAQSNMILRYISVCRPIESIYFILAHNKCIWLFFDVFRQWYTIVCACMRVSTCVYMYNYFIVIAYCTIGSVWMVVDAKWQWGS